MDLIERLRPRWRHPDPAVRAAAVSEVVEDRVRLLGIAREDPDAGVRRAALELLDDVVALEHSAANDPDATNRALAAGRLRDRLLAAACSDASVADCERALQGLSDPRTLAVVAATAAHQAVRRAALARVSGDRALRDVVRHASDPDVRHDALERIVDTDILRALADNHDGPKSVRQQARDRLAALSGGRVPVDPKEGRARQLELCTMVAALRAEADAMAAAARVAEAQREWRELSRDVEPREDVAHRFSEACDAILAAATVVDRRIAEVEHAKATAEAGIASRIALCQRVEHLDGERALRELASARAEWSRIPSLGGVAEADLGRRFAAAARECEARHRIWEAGQSLHARIHALVEEAEALVELSPVPPPKAWKSLERRWEALAGEGAAEAEMAAVRPRLDAAVQRLTQRREEDERQHQHAQKQNLTRLEALAARATEMLAAESLKASGARRHVEALGAAIADLGPLPPTERRAVWTERLTDVRDALRRKLGEVEQAEDWRRWANAAAQEEIIQRVEKLLETNDLTEGTRLLGQLQQEWEKVATATPEKSRALWERFRTVRNDLRKRCDAFMAENLAKKRKLVEQVAGVGDSTAWKETTELLRRLQAEWKEIGPVPGKYARTLWQEFRAPCEQFFARRKEQFERADGERRGNAEKKTALCEQAEGIADSTDWDATAAALRGLQAEWKRIGPAPHAENEALWQRFRGACDRFFDRHRRRDEIAREAVAERARGLCDELEALAASVPGEESPEAVAARVDAAWGDWVKLDVTSLRDAAALEERLRGVCDRLVAADPAYLRGTRLDPEATRKRREKLCARLEELAGTDDAPQKMTLQEMALALREKLATNTIAGRPSAADRKKEVARELEKAAAGWARLGPVVGDEARALAERFEAARKRLAKT